MNNNHQETKDTIRVELETTGPVFHTLRVSFTESDFRRKSQNPGWTNGKILTHMTFGFIIWNALLPMARSWGHLPRWTSKIFASTLNAFTTPFNWIMPLGLGCKPEYLRISELAEPITGSITLLSGNLKESRVKNGTRDALSGTVGS